MPRSSTTPLADYARYYTGLALTKLERYSEADKVLGDLAARKIDGHLPEDAAFLQAEVREAQKDYKGAVAIYESLVTRKLARPQTAWLRLGLAADRAGQPMRSVEALQRAYYDYPTTTEADQAGAELDRQDVDIDAALAPKELARAETLFQARRWTHARASYLKVQPFVAERGSRARGHPARRRPRSRSGGIAKAATRCGRCSTVRWPTRPTSIT